MQIIRLIFAFNHKKRKIHAQDAPDFTIRYVLKSKIGINMTAVHKDNLTSEHFIVCALYKFVALPEFEALRKPLLDVMEANEVRGTLLIASEGINGTVSAKRAGIDNLLKWLATTAKPW